MAIPSALIPALRVAFRSQGFPESTLRDDGTINPAGILAGMYEEIEFRTALTPTVKVNTRELAAFGPPNPFVSLLKPTVVLRGKGEETVIAPLGVTPGGGWLPGIAVVAGLVGIGYLLGKA